MNIEILTVPSDDGKGTVPLDGPIPVIERCEHLAHVCDDVAAIPNGAPPQPPPPVPGSVEDSIAEVKRFGNAFICGAEGQLVVELRVPNAPRQYGKPRTESGFFDVLTSAGRQRILAAVGEYLRREPDLQPAGIYLTANPVDPVFLARANNRMGRTADKISCGDEHIVRRRWLVVDVDPTRPISGVSATDAEKACARLVIDGVRDDLRGRGWEEPIFCDSGNGYHLWYPIDLPAADGGIVQRTLKTLAQRHDTAFATVDTTVFNPSRVMKIPGTWARKGDSTPDRPHRMARVLEVPAT